MFTIELILQFGRLFETACFFSILLKTMDNKMDKINIGYGEDVPFVVG